MRSARAAAKITALLLWSILLTPPQLVVLFFHKGPFACWIPLYWHKGMRAVFGIQLEIRGKPCEGRQTLYASNHLSYLDIVALGGILKASFLAKKEVSSWPGFNILAYLCQTNYIERKKTAIAGAKNELEKLLSEGRSLIIFPEGTSTDGREVRPFKSSLFSLALSQKEDFYVQPVTIAVAEANGKKPVTQEDRDLYAWHINMDTSFARHLWRFAGTSGARLVITFHEPIRADMHTDRKVLAKTCHDRVSKGLDI